MTWLAAHEGFYGPPLDHEARMAMVPWLADHGYSGYAYSPKDDPRHRQRWREAYEAEEMARFAELHQACRSAGMSFVAMVSPGLDWRGDDADLDALTAKLAAFRELGVDRLSVNWDDVPGDAESTRRHGEAVATVVARLGDGVRWTTAPVDYAACPPTASLHAFAEQLPEQVAILWTGRHVVPPTVTAADHATVEGALRRKVHFAENFPVNDLVMGDVLHLGPYPERDPGLRDRVEAVYVNFMHRPLASRVGLAGAAAFWLGDDDREAAWRAAIAELPGLEALARASRSWVATPGPDATLRSLADAAVAGDVAPLRAYLEGGCRRGIVDALAAEVEPWLVQWELEAASMLEALELLAAIDGDGAGLREVWAAVARWRQLRSAAPQVFGIRFARYPVAGIRNGEVEAAAGAVVHAENLTDRLWLALLAKLPS